MGKIIRKTACSQPGCDIKGKDNLIVFESGFCKCMACGYKGKHNNDSTMNSASPPSKVDQFDTNVMNKNNNNLNVSSRSSKDGKYGELIQYIIENGKFEDLHNRCLSKELCEQFGIYTVFYSGRWCLAFARYDRDDKTRIVGFKLKYEDGTYVCMGDSLNIVPYGLHKSIPDNNKSLIITEGELDAPSCAKVWDTYFHYTSLHNGSGDVADFVLKYYDDLIKYKSIILCLDMDEPGRKATAAFIKAFNQVGKIRTVSLPLKDANDMLQAGRSTDLKWAIYNAVTYKPKQVVTLKDIKSKILVKPQMGRPWPWKFFNDITYGCYLNKVYVVAGPEGVGKTELIKDLLQDYVTKEPIWKVGIFSLEQKNEDTMHRIIGAELKQRLDNPTNLWWDDKKIGEEVDKLEKYVYLYDPTQGINIDDIRNSIYYMVNVFGVMVIILDNLTIMSQDRTIDGKKLSETEYYTEVGGIIDKLRKELPVSFIIVGHVANDKIQQQAYVSTSPANPEKYDSMTAADTDKMINKPGMHWSSGRKPKLENIYGGGALRKLCDYAILLSRNSDSQDDFEYRKLYVEFGKSRGARKSKGVLVYDPICGKLVECQ